MTKGKTVGLDLAALEMFVLDVLRHDDLEPVSSLVRMLNDRSCIGWRDRWPHDFTADEVQAALKELVEQGRVDLLKEDAEGELQPASYEDVNAANDTVWYRLTMAGSAALAQWDPPG